MALYFIGLGLSDPDDISLKGLQAIQSCSTIYMDNYTSILNSPVEELEKLYNKKIILAGRDLVEKQAEQTILRHAKESDAAFLVVGDVMAATTHIDLWLRSRQLGIKTICIHNASVMSAIGATGLQLYKFGKTASIPFPAEGFEPESAYDAIKLNKSMGLHTLLLLDIDPASSRYMTLPEAIAILKSIESKRKEQIFEKSTFCVGCARLGAPDQLIRSGTAGQLAAFDFGPRLHCLIVPGPLHFMEEEALSAWGQPSNSKT